MDGPYLYNRGLITDTQLITFENVRRTEAHTGEWLT
jgi:hypothetical protein